MMSGRDVDLTLVRRPDWQSAAVVAGHWALTYLPVYLAAATDPSPLLLVLWLWFGMLQNGLINLMHECAHKLAFRRLAMNETLGAWILAPLVLTDFADYRRRHWQHHRRLGQADDPKVVYHTDVRHVGVWMLLLRCLMGIEALKRLTEGGDDADQSEGVKGAAISGRLVVTQAVFLASVVAVAFWFHDDSWSVLSATVMAYGVVYGYGLASVTVFAAAVRAIAEHQIGDHETAATEGDAALRNLRCNPVTRLTFGAYGFADHATHHRQPGVPYYNLPALTRSLAESDPVYAPGPGYLQTLTRLVRGRAGLDGRRLSSHD
jgi:fatty acid desaturase